MKTKLTNLCIAISLLVGAAFYVADVATSSSAAPPITKAATIRLNITQMLQRKIPIQPMIDIPGEASTATNRDAAYFAWQEFIALNWANVPVTGTATRVGAAGARETADASKKFGQSPTGIQGTSYPALVWESTRHRSEIYTGTSTQPNGYMPSASQSWGYNSTPGYVYPNVSPAPTPAASPSDCKAIQPGLTPFVNLDEASQIGVCTMFTGLPYANTGPQNSVLFMAKANYTEYAYIASRGWYNTTILEKSAGSPTNPVATFANTSGFILTQGELPAPGNVDGSSSPGPYVSFPSGTLEFKAAFRIATDAERTAYESGKPIPGGYHAAPIRYYRPVTNAQGQTLYLEYVDTCGVLLSLHIIHKTPSAPYFIFATFEHKDDVIGPDGKPVEDADGNLNANAYTTTAPTPVPSPYLYPSSGSAPAGKYLINATAPNVVEVPSQFSSGNLTVQQFMPNPSAAAAPISTKQSSYQNVRNGSSSTLPSANASPSSQSYFTVNRRRFTIPQNPIVAVNKDIHSLIKTYGDNNGTKNSNVWLNYKLVNVQWVPAGNASQKTPGQLYAGATIPVESYYLSNSLVETNMILSAFSGQFGPSNPNSGDYPDGFSITDFYYEPTNYTNNNTGLSLLITPVTPFYNVYFPGGPYNMGGCMGCHGNATVGGKDASFILQNAPFKIEGVNPDPQTMRARFQSYFRKK